VIGLHGAGASMSDLIDGLDEACTARSWSPKQQVGRRRRLHASSHSCRTQHLGGLGGGGGGGGRTVCDTDDKTPLDARSPLIEASDYHVLVEGNQPRVSTDSAGSVARHVDRRLS